MPPRSDQWQIQCLGGLLHVERASIFMRRSQQIANMSVSHVHLQIWFVRPTSIQLSHKMRWYHAWESLNDHRFLTTSTSPTSRISACSTAFLRTDTAENRYNAPSKYNRGYNNGMGFASNLEKVVSGCVAKHVEFNTTLRC